MKHDELLDAVAGRARALGLRVTHHPDSRLIRYDTGFPDLVIAGTGFLLLAEIKGRDGVLSADQKAWRSALGGGTSHRHMVITEAEWRDETVDRILSAMALSAAAS